MLKLALCDTVNDQPYHAYILSIHYKGHKFVYAFDRTDDPEVDIPRIKQEIDILWGKIKKIPEDKIPLMEHKQTLFINKDLPQPKGEIRLDH